MIGHFVPYFDGIDSYLYGVNSKSIANGNFEITNTPLKESGRSEFTGGLSKTVHNSAIPAEGVGFSLVGSVVYGIFGEYGLYYFSPIIGILLLITIERTTTKLFGGYIGFITLLLVSTSFFQIYNSLFFLTDSFFALFFVLGAFFLIKYLRGKENYQILLASSCFAFATFIRISGILIFPAELIILAVYFSISKIQGKNTEFSLRKFAITSSLVLIPWIVFFLFWFSFNDYYFGDPLTNYFTIQTAGPNLSRGTVSSFFSNPYFSESVSIYSLFLLPYPLSVGHNFAQEDIEDIIGDCQDSLCKIIHDVGNSFVPIYLNIGGVISMIALFSITSVAIKRKVYRKEIIVLMILISSIVLFYSAQRGGEDPFRNVAGRYMIPAYILGSMMYGYIISVILYKNPLKEKKLGKKTVKTIFLVLIIIFFLAAFAFSAPSRTAMGFSIYSDSFFDFTNPVLLEQRYPLNDNQISKESILIGSRVLGIEHNVIPFYPKFESKNKISDESILLLQNLVSQHEIFILKNNLNHIDVEIYNDLVNNHKVILKDHSESFCQVSFGQGKSDEVCIKNLNNP